MRLYTLLFVLLFVTACKNASNNATKPNQDVQHVVEVDSSTMPELIKSDSVDLDSTAIKDFREFKVLDSEHIDVDQLWEPFNSELQNFTESTYLRLKPLIMEQDIPTLQNHIKEGKLTYESLTKFYLYRILTYDRVNPLSLNSVIALNPNVIREAREKDLNSDLKKHPIFGMPILLKDNIDAEGMPTTAGAVALADNTATDAFIVTQLKDKGALILGKANLSEWAYFFCGDCPSGYSAIGGQTLNPYGRRVLDTGGSSSGSGVAVSANFCVAAVGSETSGSILSPSSQNSVVGMKPSIGLLSRSGIVPISSTLDTAGPMTKNVIDNALLLDAMFGPDRTDPKFIDALNESGFYYDDIEVTDLSGKRFGYFDKLLENTLYASAIEVLKALDAEMVKIEPENVSLPDFRRLLNLDMKKDLPAYLKAFASDSVWVTNIEDVIAFNQEDSLGRMPYGQKLFEGIAADSGTVTDLERIKVTLNTNGKLFLGSPMDNNNLDAILSINNFHASYAAVGEFPAITVPMGYEEENGAAKGLTFIGRSLNEKFLLQWARAYEQASKKRMAPSNYN